MSQYMALFVISTHTSGVSVGVVDLPVDVVDPHFDAIGVPGGPVDVSVLDISVASHCLIANSSGKIAHLIQRELPLI